MNNRFNGFFIVVLCVSLIIFSACGQQRYSDTNKKDTSSVYKEVSSVSNQEVQSSNPTSTVESSAESLIPNVTIDKNDLDDWGKFSSVHKLRNHFKRNLENPLYVLATVEGLVVRADNGRDIYILDEPKKFNVAWDYAKKNNIASEMLAYADDFIKVSMKDDTKNRVLTGDYIKLSGILNTSEFQFFDSEHKMIKAVE
jgi:hypothetical protein